MGSSPTSATTGPGTVPQYGPLVKRLRHRPFTAVTGVRFPHGSEKSTLTRAFFSEIKPLARICEIRCACEIRLRRVNCLRALKDLFHFTSRDSGIFHNLPPGKLFHISRKRDISLVFFVSSNPSVKNGYLSFPYSLEKRKGLQSSPFLFSTK